MRRAKSNHPLSFGTKPVCVSLLEADVEWIKNQPDYIEGSTGRKEPSGVSGWIRKLVEKELLSRRLHDVKAKTDRRTELTNGFEWES